MARYEIVVDDNDREDGATAQPWTAALWEMDPDMPLASQGDALVAGVGTTPLEALVDMLNTARVEQGDALAALEGSA